MRKTALLIGFYYDHPEWKSLCGVLIDLYHAWKHCARLGFDVRIIGDFLGEPLPSSINAAILKGYVDVEVLDFCETHSELMKKVRSRKEFEHALRTSLCDVEEVLFLYFSGHGHDPEEGGGLILPDNSVFGWESFYTTLVELCPKTTEIGMAIDCCHPSPFHLPYALVEGRFQLRDPTSIPPPQSMMCFESSHPHARSETSNNGSLFTRFFFQTLSEMKDSSCTVDLNTFQSTIDENVQNVRARKDAQKVHIYASYPELPILKSWMWCPEKIEYLLSKKIFRITK